VASVDRSGSGYGAECDVWAVGITAIELAETQPPLFDLPPMHVLYLMTKSSYKPPKLRDKRRWSQAMHDFVKCCLTKNPKKRPPPSRLLATHPLVVGPLSSRLTRELLDRVNNPASTRGTPSSTPSHPHPYANEMGELDFPPHSARELAPPRERLLKKSLSGGEVQFLRLSANAVNQQLPPHPRATSYHEEGGDSTLSPVGEGPGEGNNGSMGNQFNGGEEDSSSDEEVYEEIGVDVGAGSGRVSAKGV